MVAVAHAAAVCQPDRDVPQIDDPQTGRTWLTRARTFVTAISQLETGQVLRRDSNPDEYMAILPDGVRATIHAAGETVQIDGRGDTLVIVPPGESRIELGTAGWVTRIFSHRASDLMAMASNAETYPSQPPDASPAPPPGGFRLRVYRLDDHKRSDGPARPFRPLSLRACRAACAFRACRKPSRVRSARPPVRLPRQRVDALHRDGHGPGDRR